MTHSQGFRCKTRKVFSRDFRKHGRCTTSVTQTVFKRHEYVAVHVDGSVHKGMPHRYYHGKVGRVFDVNPHSIGVEVNKRVGTRIMVKRIYVRPEHLRKSDCEKEFLLRKAHFKAEQEKNKNLKPKDFKRVQKLPAEQIIIEKPTIQKLELVKFGTVVL